MPSEKSGLEQIAPFVLLLVFIGMLVGIGIIVLNALGTSSVVTGTSTNESFAWPEVGTLKNVTLDNGNITTLSWIRDISQVDVSGNYTLYAAEGILQINGNTTACTFGDTCYITYAFTVPDATTITATENTSSAIGAIPNTWLSLIVTVFILAIILLLVIRSFATGR